MRDGFIKVGAASPELRVGQPFFNISKMLELFSLASGYGVKVLVYPELSITGYTCQDLFLQDALIQDSRKALLEFVSATKGSDILSFVGFPLEHNGKLYNTAAAVQDGRILSYTAKRNLPCYGEFQEDRWFTQSPDDVEYIEGGIPFGFKIIHRYGPLSVSAEICEDLWVSSPPSVSHAKNGANIIVNLSASDEVIGKEEYRRNLVSMQSAKLICGYVYADASEGESTTDMVFTGADIIAENGSILNQSSFSTGALTISEIDVSKLNEERRRTNTFKIVNDPGYVSVPFTLDMCDTVLTRRIDPYPFVPSDDESRARRAEKILTLQALGLKRRIEHTRAGKLVIGLSGGLDSTLALLVSVKAMDMSGRDRKDIIAITMPCFGTTKRTKGNAEKLAEALGVSFEQIDIKKSVLQHFKDIGQSEKDFSVTYENAQARERTQVLMDKANQVGGLVIGTGDLSELALGWATYNGDHMSNYAVNASIPKTLVRHIVSYVASQGKKESKVLYDILSTPVSPELIPPKDGRISQVTEDIVGPYELHDFFLYYFVRFAFPPSKIFRLAKIAFAKTYSDDIIFKWLETFIRRFFSQQFKRSCLPDGPKVGTVTFSPRGDWRMPSDASPELFLEDLNRIKGTF